MGIFSGKQLSIKEIWLASIQLYRNVITIFWPFTVVVGIGITSSLALKANFIRNMVLMTGGYKLLAIISIIFVSLINAYLISMFLYNIYNYYNHKLISIAELCSQINKKYLVIIGAMFITFVLQRLGTFMLIIPGIFVFVLLIMVQPLIIFDDLGIIASFKASVKMVWRNLWHTFAVIFPLIFMIYWLDIGINYAVTTQKWYLIVTGALVTILFYPLLYATVLMLYNDLKIRSKFKLS